MENLFVIYIPGTGGNHLSNLISLSDRFNRDVDFTKYDNFERESHFARYENLEFSDEVLQTLKHQNNVFPSVIAEYLWNQDRINQSLSNRKFIVIESNNCTDNIAKRVKNYYHPGFSDSDRYIKFEATTICSVKFFSRLTLESDVTSLPVTTLFSPDVDPIIAFLNKEFGLKINDQSFAQHIHTQWYQGFNKIYG
jgi:hypothetical protein